MLKEENTELIIDGKRVENDYTFVADDMGHTDYVLVADDIVAVEEK